MAEPDEAEDPTDDIDMDREWKLLDTPRKWAPLAHRAGDVNVIDPTRVRYATMPPHRKVVLLVLLLAVKDRATEIRLEPRCFEEEEGVEGQGPRIRISYEVDGQFHELVPPPDHLVPLIVQEIETIAGYETSSGRSSGFIRHLIRWIERPHPPLNPGRIRWRHGDFEGDIEVRIDASERGDRLFLRLPAMPDHLSERAQSEMKRIFESWKRVRSPRS